ncbi:exodeoxyribonuclease VII large subunit [Clostridium carboxidivorans P7]|uniref:Exodeoxyribonuclease VII large subunit n=1 Tax=Clostridium carboxidivorans P7 TaxID=536227 RepID=C6PQR4_9CLOT|nr:exodeoxyribonuclease VII large subunit [Clostridium carboxidivorans P7]
MEDLQSKIVSYKNTLNNLIDFILKEKSNSLELLKRNLDVNSPYSYIVNEYNNIDRLKELMNIKIKTRLEKEREKLIKANSLLTAHNPMNILNKGYAVIENEKIGVVNTIQNLKKLDKVKITLKDGSEEFNLKIKN